MMQYLNRSFWLPHLAIDIGTYAIRVSSIGQSMEVPARIGDRRGLRGGAIVDPDTVVELLSSLVARTRKLGLLKSRAVACAPTDVSREEREAVLDCVRRAGVASVVVVPEPLAAAVGAGVDVGSSFAQLVVDIGEGVTDCAVIKGGRVVGSLAVRTGCSDMREALKREIRRHHGVAIEDTEADYLLHVAGAAGGDHRVTGCNHFEDRNAIVAHNVAQAISPMLSVIIETLRSFYLSLDDQLAAEVIDSGACLTGGGAVVAGLRELLEAEVGIPVLKAPDPLHSVIHGAQAMLPVICALNHW